MAVMPRKKTNWQLACAVFMLMTCSLLIITGTPEFLEKFKKVVKSQVKIGHEDVSDLMFTGQRIKWIIDEKTKK